MTEKTIKFKFSIQGTIITKIELTDLEAKQYLADMLDPMEDDNDFKLDVRWSNIRVHKWKQFKKIRSGDLND